MEGTYSSLRSPALTTVPSSLSRSGFSEKPLLHAQPMKLSNNKTYPLAGRLKFLQIRPQSSSTSNFSSEAAPAIPKKEDSKEEDVVFVAGATGRVGSRTVRELLKLGFRVRAAVRSSQKAETLVESVKKIKLDEAVEKLETVVCDLEKPNQIGPAIGNASIIICCIGASEKEIFDITGPYRIDYLATKNLVEAATVAKVKHFVLLTSLGTNKVGFPAAILNLFWGVLLWKRKAEEALIASGLPYTIVRPGGMERPTDTFKETHNTTLSPEDTLFGGLVSNLQVAELMACIAKNPSLSYYKVLEVIAVTTAPLTPLEDLLTKVPSKVANAFPEKEYGAARIVDPPPPESVSSEKLSIAKEKESAVANVTKQSLSPYIAYEDLKPPTSPSPSVPTLSFSSTSPANGPPQPATSTINITSPIPEAEDSKSETHHPEPKKQPLSPFTMYEDLKPPASPTPSL